MRQVGEQADSSVQQNQGKVWNDIHGGVPLIPGEVQLEADKLQSAF